MNNIFINRFLNTSSANGSMWPTQQNLEQTEDNET